jgi:hypothetical protein
LVAINEQLSFLVPTEPISPHVGYKMGLSGSR